MNKYIDDMDIALHKHVSNVTFEGFTKEEIHNIASKARRKEKINICKMVAIFSTFVFIFITSIGIYINYMNKGDVNIYSKYNVTANNEINENKEEKPNAELYVEEKEDTENNNIINNTKVDVILYKADSGISNELSAGCFAQSPEKVLLSVKDIPQIYVIKVEEILESSFATQVPITKFRASIINSIKGDKKGEIEVSSNGGITSIYEIEESNLDITLADKYRNLSNEEKKNTFVRLISDYDYNHIEEPIVGKIYIVSLDERNKVISNCEYPFLEFDLNNNLYKTKKNEWKNFDYKNQ